MIRGATVWTSGKAGILKRAIPLSDFLDRQFIPTKIEEAKINMADAGKTK